MDVQFKGLSATEVHTRLHQIVVAREQQYIDLYAEVHSPSNPGTQMPDSDGRLDAAKKGLEELHKELAEAQSAMETEQNPPDKAEQA